MAFQKITYFSANQNNVSIALVVIMLNMLLFLTILFKIDIIYQISDRVTMLKKYTVSYLENGAIFSNFYLNEIQKPIIGIYDQMKKPINDRIQKSVNRLIKHPKSAIKKPFNRRIQKPINRRIQKSVNRRIQKPINRRIQKSIN